jgi:hypothetical protein
MKTFEIYRFSPFLCRDELQVKLAFSLKRLLDAYPADEFTTSSSEGKDFFLRLREGRVDGCDYALHHLLVCSLLEDQFESAQRIIAHGAKRNPRLTTTVLNYSAADVGDDFSFYSYIFDPYDFPRVGLRLEAPSQGASARCRDWLPQCFDILASSAPQAHTELEAFRPLLLLASKPGGGIPSFGGYSSSLAWGTIALSADKTHFAQLLIQLIHELGHQLLFSLAADVPLAYNHPDEVFPSPVRQDPRPMDGLLHACFVSARLHEVLGQIQAAPSYSTMDSENQAIIASTRSTTVDVVAASLPTIDSSARLSALGERVVSACRQAVGLA